MLCHPGWPMIWPLNQLPCSSCLRLLWEWGSATTAATQDLIVCVWEPLSWLPPRCGARLFNRLASSRTYLDGLLHLEHNPSGGPSAPRVAGISMIFASHGEGLHPDDESCYGKAGSGAEGYRAAGPDATAPTASAPTTMGLPATGS